MNRTKKIEIKRILQPDVEHKEPEPPAPKPAVVKGMEGGGCGGVSCEDITR